MRNVFDIIPSSFFTPLSTHSNYRSNTVLLKFIYEQYDNEIAYRIKRNVLRDELAYFISDNEEDLVPNPEDEGKSYQDKASEYLRRFSRKDVGWLEEEFDESTFEKYIVITEAGVMLAELLMRLERPEREELASYMYNIYNTLMNQEQWNGNPYVGALKNIYKNAKALSKSLKKMSTYIRKTIEKLMKEVSYESLTENIIAYCDGEFIKEYARLTKPQNNIHIYRGRIIEMLEKMQNDEEMEYNIKAFMDMILDEENEEEYTDYRKYFKYDMRIISNQDGEEMMADLSKKQGSASNGEKQTPYFIILAASLLQCYSRDASCARLAFIDEAFSALSRERIEQMVKFFEDNMFQVIYAAPPEKIDSIGSYINTTVSIFTKGKYSWAVEGLVKLDEIKA